MTRQASRLCSSAVAVLLACVAVNAAELPRGSVIDQVKCRRDRSFSYSLYLPSGYTDSTTWPVIYCFSPNADGSLPVRLLAEAAESYGYILVGSNDVRNGPWEPVVEAQQALWKDVNSRFSIDERRSYATGFSGGARASVELALENLPRFAGLILSGGVTSPRRGFPPRAELAIYGLCGNGDTNLVEHLGAEEVLTPERGYSHWEEIFEGGHRWPSQDLFREAVEFLEVDAMRRGLEPLDESFVARVAEDRLNGGLALRDAGKPLLALHRLRQTASHFAGTASGEKAGQAAAELAAVPEVAELVRLEEQFVVDLRSLVNWNDYPSFRAGAESLRKVASGDGAMAERARLALHLTSIRLNDVGAGVLEQGKPQDALEVLHIASAVYPPNAVASYNAACASARAGEADKAIAFLKSAAANRFADVDLLTSDRDLESLRAHPEFAAVLEMVAKNKEEGLAPVQYDYRAPNPTP